jgi:dolichyl-phosphate-mannose--protein O-mannosyl transferase
LASPPDRVAWPLVRTGALLGLGISTKWNAGYGAMLVGLAIIARVLWLGWSWWTSRDADARAAAWAGVRAHLIWVPVGMALVPAAIYLLSYIPFFVSGNGRSWDDFLRIQRSMFEYHSGVEPNHIYRSRWWEWPLGLGRMWFHSDRESDPGFVHSIYVNVNPLLAIAFVPAMVWLVWRWRRGRGAALTVMLIGFFAQWLIWAVSPRSESFIYHFLPVVPFGCIAVAVALDHLWHGNQRRRTAAVVYVAAVLIVFVFLYPLVTAQPLTEAQTDARTWFDTWWRGQWQ